MKFRKKPVVIEAIQFRAGEQDGALLDAVLAGRVEYKEDGCMLIKTLEGEMRAEPGDWIIRGVKGELYPCKPDIFAMTYEPASQPSELEMHRADYRAIAQAGFDSPGELLAAWKRSSQPPVEGVELLTEDEVNKACRNILLHGHPNLMSYDFAIAKESILAFAAKAGVKIKEHGA